MWGFGGWGGWAFFREPPQKLEHKLTALNVGSTPAGGPWQDNPHKHKAKCNATYNTTPHAQP